MEALTVLLGERSLVPAARLPAAFASLTALVRATPAELARRVSEEQAQRLTAASACTPGLRSSSDRVKTPENRTGQADL